MTRDDYIAESPFLPEWVLTYSEMFTVATSLCGMATAGVLAIFFLRSKKHSLGSRLSLEYLTDFLLFVVTFMMGLALYMDSALFVKWVVVIRPFVHLLNIYAMYRLYKHYRSL